MINKMYESNLSINMGGNWKVWVEFVETIKRCKGGSSQEREQLCCGQLQGKHCTYTVRTRATHVILKTTPDSRDRVT